MTDAEGTMNQNIQSNDNLVDIRTVSVDSSLPKEERIAEFVRQIGNPCLFRCGNITIHANYAQNGPSLEECLKQALL